MTNRANMTRMAKELTDLVADAVASCDDLEVSVNRLVESNRWLASFLNENLGYGNTISIQAVISKMQELGMWPRIE